MPYLFLLGSVFCSGLLSITATAFNKKNKGQDFSSLYNLIVTVSSFIVWTIIFVSSPSFSPAVIIYSIFFAVFYITAFAGLYNALKLGSPSLTAFVKQLSLIAVAVWGLAFWNNPLSDTLVLGIFLVIAALILCFKNDKNKYFHSKWIFFALLLIIGNAGCSVVQKYQQIAFNGMHGNLLMFAATFFSSLFCCIIYMKGDRIKVRKLSHNTFFLPVVAGVSSALLNVFVLLMIKARLSESVFFPVIGVGGVLLTTLFSVAVYKEKLTPKQWTGLFIGLIAIIFLNL